MLITLWEMPSGMMIFAGRDFDVFELDKIERVAAELNPHFLAAHRAMKGELLVLHVVDADRILAIPSAAWCRSSRRLPTIAVK